MRKAIAELKDHVALATTDLELELGPLTMQAQRLVRHWMARAFESGMTYGRQLAAQRSRPPPPQKLERPASVVVRKVETDVAVGGLKKGVWK